MQLNSKWKLVESAFLHYGFQVSDRQIAQYCGEVSHTFVGKVRKALEAKNQGGRPTEKRVANRGGVRYWVNVKAINEKRKPRASHARQNAVDPRVGSILKNDFGREI